MESVRNRGRLLGGLRRFRTVLLVTLGALVWGSCSDGTGPGTSGSVHISTETTGDDPDADGYAYRIDAGTPLDGSIGPNDSVTVPAVPAGTHTVTLDGVAANCGVAGGEQVEIRVPWEPGASFRVECARNVGKLEVVVTTQGEDPDDGYVLHVDDSDPIQVDADGSAGPFELVAGPHVLELKGVADNCRVQGDVPRTVEIDFDATKTETFEVECASKFGGLEVSAETTGTDPDEDGYEVRVDGESPKALSANGSVSYASLPAGPHELELFGLAANCFVEGENPRSVEVPFGGETVATSFRVTCLSRRGNLEVVVETTGDQQDGDGYVVEIDGDDAGSVPANGSSTFPDLASGGISIGLSDVASNCAVEGDNPRNVEVPFGGETATVAFRVGCAALGSIKVLVSTTGSDLDPDGYRVTLDGGLLRGVGVNGSWTYGSLVPGDYEVGLQSVDIDCETTTENPVTVTVPGGGEATVTFSVRCSPLRGSIIFTSKRDGNRELYRMNVDGSGLERLTDHPAEDFYGRPSPDGKKIVFHSRRAGAAQIFVMNMDGSGVTQLTDSGQNLHPSWSPNGSKIAFQRGGGSQAAIFVMNSDGSNQTKLTEKDGNQPMWSPDGSKILFASQRDGNMEVYVMNPDGSDQVRLTNHPALDGRPNWSPDGSKISFSSFRSGDEDVWVMNADGSNPTNLTRFPGTLEGRSSWSPDGKYITFTSGRNGSFDIYMMRLDGTGQRRLTPHSADDEEASWIP